MAAPIGSLQWQIEHYSPEQANAQNEYILQDSLNLLKNGIGPQPVINRFASAIPEVAKYLWSKLPDSSTTQAEKLRERLNGPALQETNPVIYNSLYPSKLPSTKETMPLAKTDYEFLQQLKGNAERLNPTDYNYGTNTNNSTKAPPVRNYLDSQFYDVSPNTPVQPINQSVNTASDLNGVLSYLGNAPVEQDIKNRTETSLLATQGYRPLGLQGATPTAFGDTLASAEPVKRVSAPMSFSQLPKEQQAILLQQEQQRVWGNAPQQTQPGALAALPAVSEVSNVQSGRSAPDMSGKQYENVEYRIPGVTGYASGLRQVDPNRPKGAFSVVPGLSDAERQQAELLRAKEERQAAYRAGNGPQYDALAQQKMQYMMELGKAQMQATRDQAKEQRAQANSDRAYNFNKEKTAYQTRMNLFKELDPGPYKPTNFMEQFGKYREATMATDPEKALPDYLSNQHGIPTATDEEQKMYLKALASDKQASVPPLYYDPVSKKINVLGKDKQYYSLPWLQALNNYEKQKYDEARRSALSILSNNQ